MWVSTFVIIIIINIQFIQPNAQIITSSGNINQTFTFSDNVYHYYSQIDKIYLQEDGVFSISLNSTQSSPVMNFSYLTINPIISSTNLNKTNINSSEINGTLYPGIELKMTQKLKYCVGDTTDTPFDLIFSNPSNDTAVIHIPLSF